MNARRWPTGGRRPPGRRADLAIGRADGSVAERYYDARAAIIACLSDGQTVLAVCRRLFVYSDGRAAVPLQTIQGVCGDEAVDAGD